MSNRLILGIVLLCTAIGLTFVGGWCDSLAESIWWRDPLLIVSMLGAAVSAVSGLGLTIHGVGEWLERRS